MFDAEPIDFIHHKNTYSFRTCFKAIRHNQKRGKNAKANFRHNLYMLIQLIEIGFVFIKLDFSLLLSPSSRIHQSNSLFARATLLSYYS